MRHANPLVAVLMGSKSDWRRHAPGRRAADQIRCSRTNAACFRRTALLHETAEYVSQAEGARHRSDHRGGGRRGAPGRASAPPIRLLPVLGVPMESASLKGLDSLLSTVQMPAGIPVGTLAIGPAGARNAALLAIAILANSRPELREKLRQFRADQRQKVLRETLP